MGMPAAKKNDLAVGIDVHIVMVPAPTGPPVPTPLPHPFSGPLDQQLSPDVTIDKQPAATKGSIATNKPPHFPTLPGVSFQTPPANRGTVATGSATVKINGKEAARVGDMVDSCNDIGAPPSSVITGASTVAIG